jgi:hypothetical protein
MKKDLPIYDIVLDEENLNHGVGMISLVDDPAIRVNWIKLAKQNPMLFKSDKDKQLLYGPFLIPNMLIYRFDEKNGEYYVRFSAEEIEKIATKFNEDLNNKNINFMHTDAKVDAFVAQNWIIEGNQDKSRNFGFDLPEGTWFGSVKVKDYGFWNEMVKSEEVKGFSVEILADLELSLKNKQRIKMEKNVKFAQATLVDGTIVWYDGDLAVGTAIFVDEAMTQPAPDAEHQLEDGTVVVTVDGLVTEIRPVEAPAADEEELEAPQAQALTAEEVSLMIDSRFSELMEEITKLKTLLDEKNTELSKFKKEVSDKFSSTPATSTIKKEVKSPVDDKFKAMEEKVRAFARTK